MHNTDIQDHRIFDSEEDFKVVFLPYIDMAAILVM